MLKTLLETDNLDVILVIGILIFFGLVETLSGYLKNSKRSKGDWFQEVVSFFALSTLIKPAIVALVIILGNVLMPQYALILNGYKVIWVMIGYLLFDDHLQYWYHRTAHERPFLWKLHRSHHQAEEMGYFVSYRNAALYYMMMPNIWFVGIVVFLGGAKAVALGLILKQLIIIGSHSTVSWDKPFYKFAVLRPFIMVIERVIVTPAFHHSHHGASRLDSISDPNGNFGNMFSFWDQLYGSAKFVKEFPTNYGLHTKTDDKWTASYLYPLFKSDDAKSELSKDYVKNDTSTKDAIIVTLKKGEKYLWCKCGMSKTQPFCDGTHQGTKHKPIEFVPRKDGKVKLCNCKLSKTGQFCDDTHLEL